MENVIPQLRTPGRIAAELGEPVSRVAYALASARIQPIGRAGVIRLYDRSAVDAVRARLAEIDEKKGAARAS